MPFLILNFPGTDAVSQTFEFVMSDTKFKGKLTEKGVKEAKESKMLVTFLFGSRSYSF